MQKQTTYTTEKFTEECLRSIRLMDMKVGFTSGLQKTTGSTVSMWICLRTTTWDGRGHGPMQIHRPGCGKLAGEELNMTLFGAKSLPSPILCNGLQMLTQKTRTERRIHPQQR